MINEGIFDDKIIQLWGKVIIKGLAFFIKLNIKILNDQEISHLFDIYNSTNPSLLKKAIELLTEELGEYHNTILNIQASRTYRLSKFLSSIVRRIKRMLPFQSIIYNKISI
jgi:hypothetical protein